MYWFWGALILVTVYVNCAAISFLVIFVVGLFIVTVFELCNTIISHAHFGFKFEFKLKVGTDDKTQFWLYDVIVGFGNHQS